MHIKTVSSTKLNFTISEKEVITSINSLKPNKTPGYDGIPGEMLKASICNNQIIQLLRKVFNQMLSSGTFPQLWQINILVPLHKKGDKSNPENYRGVALGSCLAKIFCTILNKRLTKFLDVNNIVPENQIGLA